MYIYTYKRYLTTINTVIIASRSAGPPFAKGVSLPGGSDSGSGGDSIRSLFFLSASRSRSHGS